MAELGEDRLLNSEDTMQPMALGDRFVFIVH
jgi:hypothetical protein